MKKFEDLKFGFYDAENYRDRASKELLSSFFYKDQNLEDLLARNTYFLIGEKGTGKTAYGVFLSNNNYKETKCDLKFIRATDYQTFIELKNKGKINFSTYASIWKTLLLLLCAQIVTDKDIKGILKSKSLKKIAEAVVEYGHTAFNPEIPGVLEVIRDSELMGKLNALNLGGSGSISAREKEQVKSQISPITIPAINLERLFKAALKDVKLGRKKILFIDGIDVRPEGVSLEDYKACIQGLGEAVWELNIDFFSSLKDTELFKIVLLVRPDIFDVMNLQNSGNKLRDNTVLLDWKTQYPEYRSSTLYGLISHMLYSQQTKAAQGEMTESEIWNGYFPWTTSSGYSRTGEDNSFISFLRVSYFRPRDIIAQLTILQDAIKCGEIEMNQVSSYVRSASFRREYGDYLLDSLKNQTSFYYKVSEYEVFIQFFDYIDSHEFSWNEYIEAYKKYIDNIPSQFNDFPDFISDDPTVFLQFLYEANVICYVEEKEYERFFYWCYRERKNSRLNPRVKPNLRYRIHYGLHKALNVGYQATRD